MANIELFKYNKFYSTIENYSIKNFTIYGERHSGTNWLEKLITHNLDIPITWAYDHKHFFGCCEWHRLNKAHNTLFIGIVRNIYNWIGGMKKIPYHLESSDILNIRPWQSKKGISHTNSFCDSHWYTKEKYNDIFDMRYHKLQFLHFYMPYLVDNYIFIRYEDLIEQTEYILNTISNIYNLKIHTINSINSDKSKIKLYRLSQNYIDDINKNTKWLMENTIGYQEITDYNKNYRATQVPTLDKSIPLV